MKYGLGMQVVERQLKHHIKDRDRQAAEKSGEPPWFEAFLRIANEYDRSIGWMKQEDMIFQRRDMPIDALSSTVRRHSKASPNPKGAREPPVLFSNCGTLLVVDGNNRIGALLDSPDDPDRTVEVIVVSRKIESH